MLRKKKSTKIIKAHCALLLSTVLASVMAQSAYANISMNKSFYYGSVSAGFFQGSFNQKYLDVVDAIPQSIAETVTQNGYTGGLAIGYNYLYNCYYFLGIELSGHYDTYFARYQSGAATAAFSDSSDIRAHFDLDFVPGVMLTDSIEGYVKLGLSYALTYDRLSSPAGNFAITDNYSSNNNPLGFAAGLGVRKFLSDNVFIFAEGNYHDYGTVDYNNFKNFTATYNHKAHINSYDTSLGIAYYMA